MGVKKTDYTVYYQQAEKMIPWSLTFEDWRKGKQSGTDKFIEVPQEEWDEARENLICRILIKEHGFKIRACIPIEKKTVFDPEIRLKEKPIKKVVDEWAVGKQFRVKSTNTLLEIISNIGGLLELKYVDGTRFPISTNEIQVQKSLNLGVWIRL